MMKSKLFDYVERDNFIYNLSGVTKLLGFLFLTFGSMYAYDIRIGIIIMMLFFLRCFTGRKSSFPRSES